jgi:hypothetical protein
MDTDAVVPSVVENVALGLAMCADRVAFFPTVAEPLPNGPVVDR